MNGWFARRKKKEDEKAIKPAIKPNKTYTNPNPNPNPKLNMELDDKPNSILSAVDNYYEIVGAFNYIKPIMTYEWYKTRLKKAKKAPKFNRQQYDSYLEQVLHIFLEKHCSFPDGGCMEFNGNGNYHIPSIVQACLRENTICRKKYIQITWVVAYLYGVNPPFNVGDKIYTLQHTCGNKSCTWFQHLDWIETTRREEE